MIEKLPYQEDLQTEESNESQHDSTLSNTDKETIGYMSLLANTRILNGALSTGMMYIAYCVLEPILSLRLVDYDLTQVAQGAVFGIEPVTYAVSTLLVYLAIPEWVEHRVVLITSLTLLAFSTVMIGPAL